MMTYSAARRASLKNGFGMRRNTWHEGRYLRPLKDGRLMAGVVGRDEIELHNKCGSYSL